MTLTVGHEVIVKSGATAEPVYVGKILSISPTGKRVIVTHPHYTTGKATFYLTGDRQYTESYGGVSHLNNSFTV